MSCQDCPADEQGLQARARVWLGAAYLLLILFFLWRWGRVIPQCLDPKVTVSTETTLQTQSLWGHPGPTWSWITSAVGRPDSKQSGPN